MEKNQHTIREAKLISTIDYWTLGQKFVANDRPLCVENRKCTTKPGRTRIFIFLEKILRKENIQFSSGTFFPFPDFIHDAQNRLQNRYKLA